MNGKTIVIRCRVKTCGSVIVLDRDDYLPTEWTCPACELDELDQFLAEVAEGKHLNPHPTPQETR